MSEPTPLNIDPERALFTGSLDGLIALCYSNERPLQGLAGILDWRFSGAISEYIRSGSVSGHPGECTYLPIKKNDRTYHLLLVGAGYSEAPGERGNVPKETLQVIRKNLSTLKIVNMGISSRDFGGASSDYFATQLKGVSVCVVH